MGRTSYSAKRTDGWERVCTTDDKDLGSYFCYVNFRAVADGMWQTLQIFECHPSFHMPSQSPRLSEIATRCADQKRNTERQKKTSEDLQTEPQLDITVKGVVALQTEAVI